MKNTNKDNIPEKPKTIQEKLPQIYGGASGKKFAFAKEQRRNPTETENLLWTELRAKKLGGFKFRRQHPYARFVLDFYCISEQLSIEIDGGIHDSPKNIEYDKMRTNFLKENGIHEIRFSNQRIKQEMDKVLKNILEKLTQLRSKKDAI